MVFTACQSGTLVANVVKGGALAPPQIFHRSERGKMRARLEAPTLAGSARARWTILESLVSLPEISVKFK